jgi:putative iron-dependent peroxidase
VTGTLFFVPSATFLESVNDEDVVAATSAAASVDEPAPSTVSDGSLGIGSLKGENRYE